MVNYQGARLRERVLHNFRAMQESLAAARDHIPTGQFHEIRYENLVASPAKVLEASYHALQLGDFETVRSRVAEYTASLKGYKTNVFEIDAETKSLVDKHWGPFVAKPSPDTSPPRAASIETPAPRLPYRHGMRA